VPWLAFNKRWHGPITLMRMMASPA
jgi:hypothetical protein